jgi:exonuclease SbcC
MRSHGRKLEDLRNLKADGGHQVTSNEERIVAWREDRESARARLGEAGAGLSAASEKIKDRGGVVADNATRSSEIVDEITKLAPLAKRAAPLDRAEARLEELRPQATKLEAEIATARATLDELGPPEAAPSSPQAINVLEVDLADASRAQQRDSEALSAARARLERREKDDALASDLDERRIEMEVDISDWRLLQNDLGRDGLQGLEVDAAGPELTELANELLHSCYGSRFSVRIDTTHKSADGKRDIEDCLVNVTDTEQGHDGEVREFSGGERGLIGEAIDLALTTVGTRTAGLEAPTIVRDERGASQSAASERAYIAMLRRAAEQIGAPHVLFVSHREEIRSLADSCVTIKGGQFHVQ